MVDETSTAGQPQAEPQPTAAAPQPVAQPTAAVPQAVPVQKPAPVVDVVVEHSALTAMLDEARALAKSTLIKTEEGRAWIVAHIRLLEALLHGKPSTPTPPKNHV